MICMANSTLDEDAWISLHRPPTPIFCLRLAAQDALIPCFRDTIGMSTANKNCLAAVAVAELCPMRLTAVASLNWFVLQRVLFIHMEIGSGKEEPLTLPDERSVLPAIADVGTETLAALSNQDACRLERFHSLTDRSNWSGFWDASNEPVPFIMSTKELALLLALTDEEEQMTVIWLNIENGDLDLWFRRDLEELAFAVAQNVKGDDARCAITASRSIYHLQPRTHSCELCVEQLSIHGGKRHRLERERFTSSHRKHLSASVKQTQVLPLKIRAITLRFRVAESLL